MTGTSKPTRGRRLQTVNDLTIGVCDAALRRRAAEKGRDGDTVE